MKKLLVVICLFALGAAVFSGCGGAKEILIGANYEISGAVATFGQACRNAAQLAIDEYNANGGLLGKQIKLIEADNKSDAAEAGNMATKLITQDKVVLILGPVTSSNCFSAAPICQDKGVPMITPTGTNPKVTTFGEYIFRACFIDDFQGTVMANFAIDTLNINTAAVLVDNQSDYAKGLANFFKQTFTERGGTIVAEEAFMPDDKDFRALLTKIKAKNPGLIYEPSYYQPLGLIAKQARELGMNMPILGGDGWDSPALIKIAGPKPLNNAFFSNHFSRDAENPKAAKFIEDYKARFGIEPDALAALGYDAALMALDAIERANSTNPKKIREALAATSGFEGVSGIITLDENRNPTKSAVVIELKDGVQNYKMTVNP
ncbi:MAG: ABC transporter substrate-binding protein [Bacteroidota bacterium]